MRKIFIGLVCALVAACASTPEEQPGAAVEDRKPADVARPGGAQATPVPQAPVASVDLTKPRPATPGASILRDPTSILSRRSIYFDLDSYTIKDEYKAMVDAHARYLRENPSARMLIQGHTDERGSREYNLALGQKRADALKRMLTLLGAREEQLESVSLGEEKPKAQGSTEDAYSQNRRDDMLYAGEY